MAFNKICLEFREKYENLDIAWNRMKDEKKKKKKKKKKHGIPNIKKRR